MEVKVIVMVVLLVSITPLMAKEKVDSGFLKDFKDKIENMQDNVYSATPATSHVYTCSFASGDGSGTTETKIGTETGDDCIKKCVNAKQNDQRINGVTVLSSNAGGCWCEIGMTSISSSSTYKTCFLGDIPTAHVAWALRGYNEMTGSPYAIAESEKSDPGFRTAIFTGQQGMQANNHASCVVSSVTSEVVTTMQSFREKMAKSSLIQNTNPETEFSHSKSLKTVRDFFSRLTGGGISMAYATCTKTSITLSEQNLPHYTSAFKARIKLLHTTPSTQRTTAFQNFIGDYGTHFVTQVDLGAEVMETRFLTLKARQQLLKATVAICATNAFPGKASSCAQFSDLTFVESTHKVTRGAAPSSLLNWPQTSFVAVPVKMKLQRIVDLLSDANLQKQGISDVDGSQLRKWFQPLYDGLCHTMGYNCELHYNCGIGDNCAFNEICMTKNLFKETFRCVGINPCDKGDNGGCQHFCIKEGETGSKCGCPERKVLNTDKKTCRPWHHCDTNNGGCAHICNRQGTAFSCSCRAGYSLSGSTQCVLGCSWETNVGESPGSVPVYQHGVKDRTKCGIQCRQKKNSDPRINGAKFLKGANTCFCLLFLKAGSRTSSTTVDVCAIN